MRPDYEEERLLDLLASYSTEGLVGGECLEMHRMITAHPELAADHFELAATAVTLTAPDDGVDMPERLQQLVLSQAATFLADGPGGELCSFPSNASSSDSGSDRSIGGPPAPEAGIEQLAQPSGESTSIPLAAWGGWAAAAAVLVLAQTGVVPRLGEDTADTEPTPTAVVAEPRTPVVPGQRSLTAPFGATEDPAAVGAGGEVVWSEDDQTGFMRLAGLPVNDPAEYQYQLWIFDAAQDERYPIDGGVFDVAAEGEVVVAIEAKLEVIEPTLFAVTIEKPGGVVVSSRERIVLAAAV